MRGRAAQVHIRAPNHADVNRKNKSHWALREPTSRFGGRLFVSLCCGLNARACTTVSKRLCAGVGPFLGADFVGFAPRRMSQFAWARAREVG